MKLLTKTTCSHFPGQKVSLKSDPIAAISESVMPGRNGTACFRFVGRIEFEFLAGNTLFPNFKEEINV